MNVRHGIEISRLQESLQGNQGKEVGFVRRRRFIVNLTHVD